MMFRALSRVFLEARACECQNNRRQELPLLVLPQFQLRNQTGACLSDIKHWSAPYRKITAFCDGARGTG
jgi:hypothetical protein